MGLSAGLPRDHKRPTILPPNTHHDPDRALPPFEPAGNLPRMILSIPAELIMG